MLQKRVQETKIDKHVDRSSKPKGLTNYISVIDWFLIFTGALAAIATGTALPFMSQLIGHVLDVLVEFIKNPEDNVNFQNQINLMSLYFVYLAVAVFFASFLHLNIFMFVGRRIVHRLRKAYLKAVLHQDISWFDSLGAGEIATSLTNDTEIIHNGISEKLSMSIQDSAGLIASFVIALVTNWRLALVVLVLIPAIFLLLVFMNFFDQKYTKRILDIYSQAGTLAEESISSIRTVFSFNQQSRLHALYHRFTLKAQNPGTKKAMCAACTYGMISFVIYSGYALALWYGGVLVDHKEITPGEVINVLVAVMLGALSLSKLSPNLPAVIMASSATSKLFEVINSIPKIDYSKKGKQPVQFEGKIEFQQVKFSYPSRNHIPILDEFNLTVEPGSTVAIVGSSGSGKSTLIQLLERFYDPQAGSILLDGIPIISLQVGWLRQQIALVSQEPILFRGTIAENVALGLIGTPLEAASIERKIHAVRSACEKANAHEFISKLSEQYDTQVGDGGQLLSGGQKQRLAIARAIIKNPKILLLDEATSALDSQSESHVQNALNNVCEGRTTIVIAHRLSTVKNADKIVVMEKGRLVEIGTPKELLKNKNSIYRHLVQLQSVQQEFQTIPNPIHILSSDEKQATKLDNGKKFSSAAITLVSADEETGLTEGIIEQPNAQTLLSILKFSKKEWKWLGTGTIGAIIHGLIDPSFAIIFAYMVLSFTQSNQFSVNNSSFWALLMLTMAIVAGLSDFFQNMGFGLAAQKISARLRTRTFWSILCQEIGWFDHESNSKGMLISTLTVDPENIKDFISMTLSNMVRMIINILGGFVVALMFGWKLALVVGCTVPLLIGAGYYRLHLAKDIEENNHRAYVMSADMACEAVAAIRTVTSLNYQNQIMESYDKTLKLPLSRARKRTFITCSLFSIMVSIEFLVNGLTFWYGSVLIGQQTYNLEQLLIVLMALVIGNGGSCYVLADAAGMTKAKKSAASLMTIVHRQPKIMCNSRSTDATLSQKKLSMKKRNKALSKSSGTQDESTNTSPTLKQLQESKPFLQFINVNFHYPTRSEIQVLNNISFEVYAGQFIALVGPSGCGKSTVLSLIQRFYDCSQGQVVFDGCDLRDMSIQRLRNSIAVVGQEPSLFNMSIKDNIQFGSKTEGIPPSIAQIEKAAKAANIHHFIQGLSDQYLTQLGNYGSQLSGGQKQRIAIARALIRKPRLLLLDEATSALDMDSEKTVQEALDKISQNCTTIAVAHRLSTIQHADIILVFQNGSIVERGDHSQLLKIGGVYSKMVKAQSLDDKIKSNLV